MRGLDSIGRSPIEELKYWDLLSNTRYLLFFVFNRWWSPVILSHLLAGVGPGTAGFVVLAQSGLQLGQKVGQKVWRLQVPQVPVVALRWQEVVPELLVSIDGPTALRLLRGQLICHVGVAAHRFTKHLG